MASLNKQLLIGNVGADPRVSAFENNRKVAQFSLATTETYKDRDGNRQETTEWHNIVAWSPLAEVVEQYVKKGSCVYIEGRTRSRQYQTKDGETRYTTEVLANVLQLLDRKPAEAQPRQYQNQAEQPVAAARPAAQSRPAAPAPSRSATAPQNDFSEGLGIGADGAVSDDLPF